MSYFVSRSLTSTLAVKCLLSLGSAFALLSIISCGGGGTPVTTTNSTTKTLSSIAVAAAKTSITNGGTDQFTATGTYSDNSTADLTSSVTWSSSSTAIATVSSAGLVTAVAPGVTNITASSGSLMSPTVSLKVTSSLSISSISDTAPIPLTPVQISTSGLDVNSAVTIQLSDGAGYSVTEPAIRVASDGTVTAAVPLYAAKGTQTIGPGTVSLVLQQGSNTSNAMALNIQDLPPLSAYNVQPGEISHAMFQLQATLIGRRLNEFQSIQAAMGNTVDTTQGQAHLSALLNAVIQARSDVDRVTSDNTVVVPGGTLPDGNSIQFDQTTLDLMDRIQAVFLSGPFGDLVAQGAMAKVGEKQHARLRRHSNGALWPGRRPHALGPHFEPEHISMVRNTRKKSSNNVHTDGLTIKDLTNVLQTMEGVNNIKDLIEGTQGLINAQGLLDAVKAFGTGAGAVNSILTDNTIFGLYAAVMSTVDVTTHCWGDVGAWVIAEATGNQAAANLAVQDMANIPLGEELRALQTLALAPFSEIPIVNGASTVLNFAENAYTYFKPDTSGNSEANSDYQTQLSIVNSDAPVFASSAQGLVEATGSVTETTNLGIEAPQSGIELSPGPNGETISTVADPNGDYDMFLPLGVSGFDYTSAGLNLFDPISAQVLDTESVDLSGLSTNTIVQIPAMQGTCNDNDAGTPDQDDPDCD
jgi:hypothetical protein